MVKNSNDILKNRDYVFDEKKVQAIINEFCKSFIEKKSIIEKAIEADFSVEKIKLEYTLMLKQIQNIKKIKLDIFSKSLNQKIKTGRGNIAVMYDGNSYITLDFILKALVTHNDVYLFSSDYMLATNTIIIKLLTDIIKKYKYDATIKHLQVKTEIFKEVSSNQASFDLLVYIGDKYEFKKIRNDFNRPIIFKGFGTVYIYKDKEPIENTILMNMERFAYNNNINLEYFSEDKIEDIISKINDLYSNDTVVLFTKNSNIAFNLISRLNSEKIFINKNPFEDYIFNFDENILIIEKELFY